MRIPFVRAVVPVVALIAFLGVSVAAWYGRDLWQPREPEGPPDIFLFTIDTLRADHLPPYGYERETAPWITWLAEDAVVFDAASATSSWTVPSIGSMLTGMMPRQLRIEHAPSIPGPDDPRPKLPAGALTLAERLKAAGYRTFAVTANEQVKGELGYAQGFDRYVNVDFAEAKEVVNEVSRLRFEIFRGTGPVFVWVHLFDPHDPYSSPNKGQIDEWSPRKGVYSSGTMEEIKQSADTRDPQGLAALEALYDAEIAYADDALGRIAELLRVGDDDVVVFTADHGEEFRDHGHLGHRIVLYEETLRVPLIARWKGRWEPRRVTERVSLASLTPTLAAVGGAPVGAGSGLAAGSLVPLLEGEKLSPTTPPVVAELVHSDNVMRWQAIYDGNEKLITSPSKPERTQLYDLSVDPGERDDSAVLDPVRVRELQKKLDQFLASLPALRPEWVGDALDPEVCANLKSMGYLSGDCGDVKPDTPE